MALIAPNCPPRRLGQITFSGGVGEYSFSLTNTGYYCFYYFYRFSYARCHDQRQEYQGTEVSHPEQSHGGPLLVIHQPLLAGLWGARAADRVGEQGSGQQLFIGQSECIMLLELRVWLYQEHLLCIILVTALRCIFLIIYEVERQ